ncbi:MAG: toll/interleukin-1 receptor domain-containing protein [Acidobacteria bacterium]|nr:toll/interleukin-1 receptor domain-containing protein [Acidobacteriota bacterium]
MLSIKVAPSIMKGSHRLFFICYRREDRAETGRLYDSLVRKFGEKRVFRDIHGLHVGEKWPEETKRRIAACDAVIVVIGPNWLGTEKYGRRRLDDPNDPVRREIEEALASGVRLVPVLVEGAAMPEPQLLPPTLQDLVRFHAQELTDTHYSQDVARLIRDLQGIRVKPVWVCGAVLTLVVVLTFSALWLFRKPYISEARGLFHRGAYEEAIKTLNLGSAGDQENKEAQDLRSQTVEVLKSLRDYELGIKWGEYTRARDALVRAEALNQSDPNTASRRARLDAIFSPAFQDEFLGGLDFWNAPKAWRADRGRLIVQGPGLGVLKGKYYEDFTATFNISFLSPRGAVWILRATGNLSHYYIFQLTGAAGKPPNSFSCLKCINGKKETVSGPVLVGADLSKKDDQYNITVKAEGDKIEHQIELVSEPLEGPRSLGQMIDATFPGGTIGFGTMDDEEFSVRAFKVVPLRKSPSSD